MALPLRKNLKRFSDRLEEESLNIRLEILEKLSTLITAGFALVAALAWNSAIQQVFTRIFGTPNTLWAMVSYALIVTFIAVLVTMKVGSAVNTAKARIEERKERKKKEKRTIKLVTCSPMF